MGKQYRFVNPDGTFNVRRRGTGRVLWRDTYHWLLSARWRVLLGSIVALYFGSNAVFALCYLLGGDCIQGAKPGAFADAYWFSVQTMSTVGYGVMAPKTLYAHALVTVEVLFGHLFVAMTTGLTFAKFSRPTSQVVFSRAIVKTAFDGRDMLMFRMGNMRTNHIADATVRVVLARDEITEEGHIIRRLADLHLIREHSSTFVLSWLAMHVLDEESPLYGMTLDDWRAQQVELVISLTGVDDTFGQTIHARYSYTADQLRCDEMFEDVIQREDGMVTIDYSKFHDTRPAPRS